MRPVAADLDTSFAALADATRRAVIRELLREPLRAGELAERVNMSPPALSRHLRVLREAGLIVEDVVASDARVSLYKVDLEAFAPVRHWLDEVEAHWHEQLASFKEYAERSHAAGGRSGSLAAGGPVTKGRSTPSSRAPEAGARRGERNRRSKS